MEQCKTIWLGYTFSGLSKYAKSHMVEFGKYLVRPISLPGVAPRASTSWGNLLLEALVTFSRKRGGLSTRDQRASPGQAVEQVGVQVEITSLHSASTLTLAVCRRSTREATQTIFSVVEMD